MSITCMMHVWWNSPSSGNERLVLLAIADEADDEGRNAYPSVRRLANKINAHTATVLRAIVNLEKAGEMEVKRPEVKGRGRSNKYRVIMQAIPSADEIRSRYTDEPVENQQVNGSNLQPLTEKNARITQGKRAHSGRRMVAPMRADPITPINRPANSSQFHSQKFLTPEEKYCCDQCIDGLIELDDGTWKQCGGIR